MARTHTSAPSSEKRTVGPSLGWGVLAWMAKHLPSPADPLKPLILTDEQAWLVLRWYAVDADTGEFLHRRGELEMAKGWGKSPFAAALALAEFVGPVVFDHWGENGEPVGRPWANPWVQIAAVSEDQTDNTYHALYEMLVANDHKAARELGIDDGRTRLYLKGRPGVLEPVTASAGSREGQRVTFSILDETHLWTRRNGGVRLAGTIRRNAAKMGGRTFETTNAPVPGEKSVAEQSGLTPGVLRYARRPAKEPEPTWSDEKLLAALAEAYGDSWWIDLRRLVSEIRDPETDWDDALRFYFNIRTAGQGRAVDPVKFATYAAKTNGPPERGTRIGLGFDGSISYDSTALRGCTESGYRFTLHIWERPKGDEMIRWQADHPGEEWRVPRPEVHAEIAKAFETYSVGRFFYDPPRWWTEGQMWAQLYGKDINGDDIVLALDTNQPRRFAPAVERWRTDMREGKYSHDDDPTATAHIRAAHLRKVRISDDDGDARTLHVLVKGDDGAKIDAAIADVLASEAAATMPTAPPEEPSVYATEGILIL